MPNPQTFAYAISDVATNWGGGDNQDVDERKGLDKFTTLFVMMVHKRQQPSFFLPFVGKFGICCFLSPNKSIHTSIVTLERPVLV